MNQMPSPRRPRAPGDAQHRLARPFFEREPDAVALDLIGSLMRVRLASGEVTLRLTETEAYGGVDDAASHAFRGRSARNASMFGPPGHLYVYLIYGLHWCVNVVTEGAERPSAVLLRAAEVLVDAQSPRQGVPTLLRGPGNLTRALGITRDDDGLDCCDDGSRIRFFSSGEGPGDVARSVRIGISRERERESRYYLVGSASVTPTPRRPRGDASGTSPRDAP